MRTKTYHHSNLGSFAPRELADNAGYIRYHDSPRYSSASYEQLAKWAESPTRAVRAAAITEQCERRLEDWRRSHHTPTFEETTIDK